MVTLCLWVTMRMFGPSPAVGLRCAGGAHGHATAKRDQRMFGPSPAVGLRRCQAGHMVTQRQSVTMSPLCVGWHGHPLPLGDHAEVRAFARRRATVRQAGHMVTQRQSVTMPPLCVGWHGHPLPLGDHADVRTFARRRATCAEAGHMVTQRQSVTMPPLCAVAAPGCALLLHDRPDLAEIPLHELLACGRPLEDFAGGMAQMSLSYSSTL